jgi:crotonobetainyl-CoA:carnitine CoA-transferase CaiB-like acyl-CoA transferase
MVQNKNGNLRMNMPAGALDGLRVIDLTRVLAGPYCTQMLGDHGADILKIEPPGGDETRAWGPPFHNSDSSYFLGLNRNKRSIVLDLSQYDGRAKLLELLVDADVMVENFKPGTLEKWGLGYKEILAKRFPRLVHCCVSGFGADGPMGGLPGYDAAIQAMCGLMSINGDPAGEPIRIGIPIVDIVTSLNAAIGILLALQERVRSGRGQSIDIALHDSAISALHPHTPNYLYSGRAPQRSGNAHPNISPYDTYKTRTTPIFLAVGNDRQFEKLVTLIGRPGLARDPRFKTNFDRIHAREGLKYELEELLAHWNCDELAEKLIRNGVPCGPVRSVDQVLAHPHTTHRGMLVKIGDYLGIGAPIKMSRNRASYRLKPPQLGEHDGEV